MLHEMPVLCISFSKHTMGSNETEAHELLFRQQFFIMATMQSVDLRCLLCYHIYIAVTIINDDLFMCTW